MRSRFVCLNIMYEFYLLKYVLEIRSVKVIHTTYTHILLVNIYISGSEKQAIYV